MRGLILSRMRTPFVALAALQMAAACGERPVEPAKDKAAPGTTVMGGEFLVNHPFGSVIAQTPANLSQDEADHVYEEHLTKACATLETRIVEGPVLSDGRTCVLLSVNGLIPTRTLLFSGMLRSTQGEMFDVAWIVQENAYGEAPSDLVGACRQDPTQGQSGPWILSRNRQGNLWHLAPRDDRPDLIWRFSPDVVRQSCAEREASARRIQELVARRRASR